MREQMRLWSINPKYLDSKGLCALWRESLLAQKVLCGNTKGYKSHPQLIRFKKSKYPMESICSYLYHVYQEACFRGYNFDYSLIQRPINLPPKPILVTKGQILYEMLLLANKVKSRDFNTPIIYCHWGRYRRLGKTSIKKGELK